MQHEEEREEGTKCLNQVSVELTIWGIQLNPKTDTKQADVLWGRNTSWTEKLKPTPKKQNLKIATGLRPIVIPI